MAHGGLAQRSAPPARQRLLSRPSTREGRRASRLFAGGLALILLTTLLVNVAGLPSTVGALSALGLLSILGGGGFAAVAVARRGERSLVVLATAFVGLLVLIFVIGEFSSPH